VMARLSPSRTCSIGCAGVERSPPDIEAPRGAGRDCEALRARRQSRVLPPAVCSSRPMPAPDSRLGGAALASPELALHRSTSPRRSQRLLATFVDRPPPGSRRSRPRARRVSGPARAAVPDGLGELRTAVPHCERPEDRVGAQRVARAADLAGVHGDAAERRELARAAVRAEGGVPAACAAA
jgi:hypothetical protein